MDVRFPASITFAAAMLLDAVPSQAQTYATGSSVCMKIMGGSFTGERIECSYATMKQCQASAYFQGATCVIKSLWFAGGTAAAQAPAMAEYRLIQSGHCGRMLHLPLLDMD